MDTQLFLPILVLFTLSMPIIIGFCKQHRSRGDGSYELSHLDLRCLTLSFNFPYEDPAKSFVTGFGLLQCYILSNIFITNLQSIPPLLKHTFVTFLPSREKQINSLLLVSVGDTDK